MPDETTEAALDSTEDTSKDEVTDEKDETVQPKVDETDNTEDDDDPIKAYQKQFVETEKAKLEQEIRSKVQQEFDAEQASARQAQLTAAQRKALQDSFSNAAKKTKTLLESTEVYDKDGERLKFNEDDIQKFVEPWQAHNAGVQSAVEQQIYQALGEAAVNSLPKEAREDFAKKASGKPLPEYLKAFAELLAPHTEYTKSITGDVETKVKAAEARGFAKGQKAPAGTPRQIGDRPTVSSGEKPDTTTLLGAAQALAKHQITEEQYREIHRKIRG